MLTKPTGRGAWAIRIVEKPAERLLIPRDRRSKSSLKNHAIFLIIKEQSLFYAACFNRRLPAYNNTACGGTLRNGTRAWVRLGALVQSERRLFHIRLQGPHSKWQAHLVFEVQLFEWELAFENTVKQFEA